MCHGGIDYDFNDNFDDYDFRWNSKIDVIPGMGYRKNGSWSDWILINTNISDLDDGRYSRCRFDQLNSDWITDLWYLLRNQKQRNNLKNLLNLQ